MHNHMRSDQVSITPRGSFSLDEDSRPIQNETVTWHVEVSDNTHLIKP